MNVKNKDIRKFQKDNMAFGHSIGWCNQQSIKCDNKEFLLMHDLKDGIPQIYWYVLLEISERGGFKGDNFDIRSVTEFSDVELKLNTLIMTRDPLRHAANILMTCKERNPDVGLFDLLINADSKCGAAALYLAKTGIDPEEWDGIPF